MNSQSKLLLAFAIMLTIALIFPQAIAATSTFSLTASSWYNDTGPDGTVYSYFFTRTSEGVYQLSAKVLTGSNAGLLASESVGINQDVSLPDGKGSVKITVELPIRQGTVPLVYQGMVYGGYAEILLGNEFPIFLKKSVAFDIGSYLGYNSFPISYNDTSGDQILLQVNGSHYSLAPNGQVGVPTKIYSVSAEAIYQETWQGASSGSSSGSCASGCLLGDKCYSAGDVLRGITPKYCSNSGYFLDLNATGEACVHSFECASGKCQSGVCISGLHSSPNKAPEVSAGNNITISLPSKAALLGKASDDMSPIGELNVYWTKVSGPGRVSFYDNASARTLATFSAPGKYVLKLTATDTVLENSSEVTITVKPELKSESGSKKTAENSSAAKANSTENQSQQQNVVPKEAKQPAQKSNENSNTKRGFFGGIWYFIMHIFSRK